MFVEICAVRASPPSTKQLNKLAEYPFQGRVAAQLLNFMKGYILQVAHLAFAKQMTFLTGFRGL